MEKQTWFIAAIGHNIAVVLDGDDWIKGEIRDLSHHLDDIGIPYPSEMGLYHWSGTVAINEDCDLPEPEYSGSYVCLHEWAKGE